MPCLRHLVRTFLVGFLMVSSTAKVGIRVLCNLTASSVCCVVLFRCSLLWEQLSGREHLQFYGRLKNLKGKELNEVREKPLP